MVTLFPIPTESSTIPSPADFEPEEQWKARLKLDIENNLRSMVDEAKQNLQDTLKKAPVSAIEREKLTEEHLATMKNIRDLAEEQFRIALERERQERRWAAGQTLDREWSESMIKEQQAILDRIEKERNDKAPPHHSSSVTSQSPTIDELDDMPRSTRSTTDPQDSIRRRSLRRKASLSTRPVLPEFWLPSITPEEDAQLSRTFSIARRGSTASVASSYRAQSVINVPLSPEQHDTTNSAMERERDRISAVEQEWSNIDRARDRERTTSYTYSEARASLSSTPQRQPDERYPPPPPLSSLVTHSPSSIVSIGYPRSSDSSRPPPPPPPPPPLLPSLPSASRPIATKKSFSFDDGRSPQTPEEVPRSWQSSNLRTRISSQDMRYGYFTGESGYYPRPVHTHHEVSEGEYDEDLDDADWRDYDERKIRQREDSFRRREEEVARREQELKRREEEAKREEETKQKEIELMRKEEEAKRKEEEAKRKEEEVKRKEEEAKRKEEETRRKEVEIRRKEEQVMRRQEEAERKEEEVQRRQELKRRLEETKRDEEAKQKEMELMRKEEEARRKEVEIRRKAEEAMRRQEEAERKEEEARRKELEIRRKEEAARAKEEELARREEELLRREAEAIRKSDDKQKVQQEEFRRREEEIRRQRAEEKKKQERWEWESWGYHPDSSRPAAAAAAAAAAPPPPAAPAPAPQMAASQSCSSSTGPWPIPNRPERKMSAASPPTDRSSFGSTGTSRSSPAWTSSSRPSSTASTQAPSTPKPPTPSGQQNAKAGPGASPAPMSEAEFHRRQAEQAQRREEQFRREQAKLEQERLAKAGKGLNKQETMKLFEHHRGQWDKLQMTTTLIWDDFPWPVFKRPSGADEVTTAGITAYMLSSLHSVEKSSKDRIKENIRRWHPDRFETQLLPRVKDSDRDGVREAAGTVVRTLNDLLRSSTQEFF